MWVVFLAVVKRDLIISLKLSNQISVPILFFIVVVTLFPLGIGADSQTLSTIAPGIIWVCALLANFLSLRQLFRNDFDDGSLEVLLLSPHPTALLISAKILVHWLTTGIPLIIISPLLGLSLNLPPAALFALVMSLSLGTPTLSLIGAIGAALTVGLRGGGALLSLVILPLYIPVLIFGASAVDAAAASLEITGQMFFLAALLVLAITLAPVGAAAALRATIN